MPKGRLLGHRDFRLLWGGETISEVGSQFSLLAIPLMAVQTLGATTFEVGVLAALSTAAFLVIGLPAGVMVDRTRRRWVMITADLGRVALLGSVPLAYALGGLTLGQLFAVAFFSGIFTVFFDVAYQSYLPSLVGRDHLVEGNAKLTGSEQVAQVAGPSLAGALIQAVGGAAAIGFDAVSFLISGGAIAAIRSTEPAPVVPSEGHHSVIHDIHEGLRFVFGQPLLRAIMASTATANFFGGIQAAVEIVFLVRVVNTPSAVIGLLFAMAGIGGIVGAFVATPLAHRVGGARATIIGSFASVGGLLMPLATPHAGLLLFGLGLLSTSFGAVLYNINQVSFRQQLCPDRLLGRMNASMRFVVWGVLPVGALLGGIIGSTIGLRQTLWIAMIGQSLAGFWLVASPMRSMRDFPAGTH